MTQADLERLSARLLAGETPEGVVPIESGAVRLTARCDHVFLKVFRQPSSAPAREARALRRAASLGVPVPELIASGEGWLATRFRDDARPATRGDLAKILPVIEHMHAQGMLHRDLHLGNVLVAADQVLLVDLGRPFFLPWLPRTLRERELGFLAYSLGEPLPSELEHVRDWSERRARVHWRSRTRRCLVQSTGFTRFEFSGEPGFRRRDADEDRLRHALDVGEDGELIKLGRAGNLFRVDDLILKQHASRRAAKASWVAGRGLEVRGIATGLALAWTGRWLVMRDQGDTLIDWIKANYEKAPVEEREEMGVMLSDLLARLHRRGVYHADLKANNILWAPGREARLVDYGRVHFTRRVGFARRVKNLAQINAALPDYVPASLRESALARYLHESGFRGDAEVLKRETIALSLSRRHRWHGC